MISQKVFFFFFFPYDKYLHQASGGPGMVPGAGDKPVVKIERR